MGKIIAQICMLQGIKENNNTVNCPYCHNRAVYIHGDHWQCKRCSKSGDLMELLKLAEEDYLYRHKNFERLRSETKGVGY